ncbi:sensor histidine kinase [Cohnella luojiensis]|uniref:HAMP domain-containing protein n=1 Tax=Cohnella luojiensis TaxID=652876 RepID=A0A4Y8LU87_9BACL|nr:histidine kinase [Cohnella luojiensis]TFE23327.1 HAMP domain-containing protein [Cohnella luojiensis]
MKRKWFDPPFHSIRFKVISMTLLIVFFSLSFIGIYFYQSMNGILRDNADDNLTRLLEQTNNNLESQLGIIDTSIISFLSNPVISAHLEEQPITSPYSKQIAKSEIEEQMIYLLSNNYLWENDVIESVVIVDDYGDSYYVFKNYDNLKTQINRNLIVYDSSMSRSEDTQIVNPAPEQPIIYFVKSIRSIVNYDYKGKIILGINEVKMNGLYDGILHYGEASAFLTDADGSILSTKNTSLLGKKMDEGLATFLETTQFSQTKFKGIPYFIATKKIEKYDWTFVILIPQKQVLSHLSESIGRFIPIAIGILLFFLVLGYFFSSKATRPILDILKRIEQIRKGDYSTRMPAYKELELNKLATVFNKMSGEMQYLITNVYESQLLVKESELKSLHAQMNPHFLFNVLETISWHARMSDNTEIYEMVTSLGYMLRTSLAASGQQKSTVREELKYIDFYILLQKKRFGERLQVEIAVKDDLLLDSYLPKLSIQPIVENAIVHGLEPKVGDWRLSIGIFMDDEMIFFVIEDNGVGFARDRTEARGEHNHIALYNVNRRIQLLYGDLYGIGIESQVGQGTTVTVRIPVDIPNRAAISEQPRGDNAYVPSTHR